MQTVMGDPSIHGFATLAGKSFLPGQIAASSPAGAWRYTALSRKRESASQFPDIHQAGVEAG